MNSLADFPRPLTVRKDEPDKHYYCQVKWDITYWEQVD
jgi:hypothetical protein